MISVLVLAAGASTRMGRPKLLLPLAGRPIVQHVVDAALDTPAGEVLVVLGPEPDADPYTTLVHAARATDVRLTMVDGRVLYRDGRWSTLDPDAVRREARQERRGLLRRVEAHP